LIALALLLAAAAVWAIPVWRDLFHSSIGVQGDPSQYIWDLAWFPHAVASRVNPFLSDYLNHPAGVNLMWNTAAPAVALAAAPLTALVGPIAAYNLLMPLGMAVSGWCAYLAARHLGASMAGGLAAGLLFEFSPYELAQGRAHLSTVVAGFAPLLAIVLHEGFVRRRRPAWQVGVAAGGLAAVQLLILEEYVATGALVALIAAAVLRPRWRHALLVAGSAAITFLVLGAYPLAVQFFGPHRPAAGTLFHEQGRFVTDLANLLVPTNVQLFGDSQVPFTGTLYELDGYIGLPLLAVLAWSALTRWRDGRVRVLTILTLAVVVLSLGPSLHVYGRDLHLPLPWAALDRVPLLGNALPARMALYVDTGVALLAAIALDGLRRQPGALGLVVLAALTLLPAPPPTFPQPVPPFFTRAEPIGAVALLVPWPREGVAQGMVWQAVSGLSFKMPGGYFLYADPRGREFVGSPPTPLSDAIVALEDGARYRPPTSEQRARLRRELREDGVRDVLVAASTPNVRSVQALFTDLLGRAPRRTGGMLVWSRAR
jgi:hypothetical protein